MRAPLIGALLFFTKFFKERNMEQNKDRLLGDLYALRAGLSMISEEADNIAKI